MLIHVRIVNCLLLVLIVAMPVVVGEDTCKLNARVENETGQPAEAGIMVEALTYGSTNWVRRPTDATGMAVFEALPCGLSLVGLGGSVQFARGSPHNHWDEQVVTLSSGQPVDVRLVLPRVVPVRISAEDEDGRPERIPYLAFHPRTPPTTYRPMRIGVSSGLSASYTALLPIHTEYEIKYRWDKDKDIATTFLDGAEVGKLESLRVADKPIDLSFILKSKARFSGSIVTEEGNPVPEMLVMVGTPGFSFAGDKSAADGSFEITVSKLPTRLYVRDLDGRLEFEPETITLSEGDSGEGIRFVARPTKREPIIGQLIADTNDGPVGPAEVSLSLLPLGPMNVSVKTDSVGRFEAPCFPDITDSMLMVRVKAFRGFMERSWRGFSIKCGEQIEIQLERGANISGRVLDRDGAPLVGLPIQAKAERHSRIVFSDNEGKYEFDGVVPGEYALTISERWSNPQEHEFVLLDEEGTFPELVIEEPGESFELDLVAVEPGEICATVVDENDQPFDYSDVRAVDVSRNRTFYQRDVFGTTKSEVCSVALAPGQYLVKVGTWSSPFAPTWYPGSIDPRLASYVEVREGENTTIGPIVGTPSGSLRARVERGWNFGDEPRFIELDEVLDDHSEGRKTGFERELGQLRRESWGVYLLRGLPVGRWNLKLCETADKCESKFWYADKVLEITSDTIDEVLLEVWTPDDSASAPQVEITVKEMEGLVAWYQVDLVPREVRRRPAPTTWKDLSGNRHHLKDDENGESTVFYSEQVGKNPAALIRNAKSYTSMTPFEFLDHTIFLVYRTDVEPCSLLRDDSENEVDSGIVLRGDGKRDFLDQGNGIAYNTEASLGNEFSITVLGRKSGVLRSFINGVDLSSHASWTEPIRVGKLFGFSDPESEEDEEKGLWIAEMIFFERFLTGTERETVTQYLAEKYKIEVTAEPEIEQSEVAAEAQPPQGDAPAETPRQK